MKGTGSRAVVAGLLVGLATGSGPVAAGGSSVIERLLTVAAAYEGTRGLSAATLHEACGGDALCVARRIVATGDGRARLERVEHPGTDVIRWVTTVPSVTAARRLADGRRLIVLEGFGRTAVRELRAALAGATQATSRPARGLVLDLRGNGGGDLGRMLAVASLFVPSVKDAFYIVGKDETALFDIPARKERDRGALTVLVGPGTASSGEILAALLRRYAGARVLGEPTAGKDRLYRVVPVEHDWRLLLPAERVVVPGEVIAGGLRPDGPIPPTLAARLAEAEEGG